MIIYKKLYNVLTGEWDELPFDENPENEKVVINDPKERLRLGHYKGIKAKSFSELTEEEKELINSIDKEDSNDNTET